MAYLLIVDDDEDFANGAAIVLRKAGHEVEIILDTETALLSMENRIPDLLILDVMFPENSTAGFELARTMRNDNDKLETIPILMLTAVNTKFPMGFSSRDIDDSWLPVSDFVEKPVDFDVLTNHCLEKRDAMLITVEKALKVILAQVCPCGETTLPLYTATGYCLAEDIFADRDQPPSDRSAMDGYAVRSADVQRVPVQLTLVGEIAAGSAERPMVTPGTCVRILTGASIPSGADAVVKVEDTAEENGIVIFHSIPPPGANIRKQAEEIKKGSIILGNGMILDAVQIGLCASVGKNIVKVYTQPRVTILCTGKELLEGKETVASHQLRDSNGPSLCAALTATGYRDVPSRIVTDDPEELVERMREAIQSCDVVILTGGVSVGKYDYVPEAVKQIGAAVHFHGVAMKPGKPQLYATYNKTCHIFGLPGNPLSVFTGFHEFVLPAVRRMSGIAAERCRPRLRLPLAKAVRVKGGRTEYILVQVAYDSSGSQAIPIKSHGSADLTAAARADGVIAVPPDKRDLPAGHVVDFTPWRVFPCS